ncbi:MAG: PAS domain S-box protein [Melioribacteraceae bacterium]|nr:PAS domain S-box protein [Melioribacteraceae bacterium]
MNKKNKIKARILFPVAIAIYFLIVVFYIVTSQLMIILEVSDEVQFVDNAMLIIFGIGLAVSLILIIFINFILGRVEKDIVDYEDRLLREGKLHEIEQKEHIEKLFEDEKKLKHSEKKLRLVFENSKDVIIWANPKTGIITNCNLAAETLLEYNRDEIIGQLQTFLHPKDEKEKYQELFKNHVAAKGALDGEVTIVTKSGLIKYVDISATVISVGDEEIIQGVFRDITEQREIEKYMFESEERFQQVAEYSDSIIWEVNEKLEIIYTNSVAEMVLGYTPEELIGNSIFMIFPNSRENYRTLAKQRNLLRLEGKYTNLEYRTVAKDGKIVWMRSSGGNILNDKGEFIGVRGISTDITEEKKTEREIFESEERFKQIASSTKSIVWEVDNRFKFIYLSSSVYKILGYSEADVLGKSIFDHFYNSEEVNRIRREIIKSISKTGKFSDLESKFLRKDGKVIWTSTSGFIKRDVDKTKVKYIGSTKDITEKKEAERKILEGEERFLQVADYSNSIVWEINNKNEYTYINSVVEKILGYRTDELIGNNGYIHFADCEENSKALKIQKEMLEAEGKYSNLEFKLETKEGNPVWVRSSGGYLKNDKGEIIGRRGISTDITENKKNIELIIKAKIEAEKAEKKIRASEEKNRSILEAIPDIIFIFDKDGVFLDYHIRSNDKLNFPPEEFLGKNIEAVFPKEIAELTKKNITKTLSNKEICVFRYSFPISDKTINEEARMVQYDDDKVLTMIRDITDVIEAEKNLIEAKERAERADSLKSTFLAQMSHEIRTPINSIVSLSSLIEEVLTEHADDDTKTCFNLISKSGDRIIRTTDLLLNLSEIEAGTYEMFKEDFNLVDSVLNKLYNEYLSIAEEENLKLKLDINLRNPIISADSYTVEQIFCNIINNAIKYTTKGEVVIKAFENSEKKTTVEIIDTGIGISKDYLPKIFTSFSQEMTGYTRKYEGNGVGLTLVSEFCKLNNATIEVESIKGEGSTFRVVFE